MKKLKLLPLLGAGLLALTGCSSSANEISRSKSLKLYKYEEAEGYFGEKVEGKCYSSFEPGSAPEVVKLKSGTDVTEITNKVISADFFSALIHFEDNDIVVQTCFYDEYEEANIYNAAKVLGEVPTYNLEGKVLTVSFTGATQGLYDGKYGFALHLEAKYNKVGLLYKSSFLLAVSTDLNASNEAQTVLKYRGNLQYTWGK